MILCLVVRLPLSHRSPGFKFTRKSSSTTMRASRFHWSRPTLCLVMMSPITASLRIFSSSVATLRWSSGLHTRMSWRPRSFPPCLKSHYYFPWGLIPRYFSLSSPLERSTLHSSGPIIPPVVQGLCHGGGCVVARFVLHKLQDPRKILNTLLRPFQQELLLKRSHIANSENSLIRKKWNKM